ncbi:MAG TPA: hypothetical protein VF875_18855, partial [Anaeromyxobacter sp.]
MAKASQTIFSEMELGRLAGTLLQVVLARVSVRWTAPRSPRARVGRFGQARPPEASHGRADEEAGAQVGLAAVEDG